MLQHFFSSVISSSVSPCKIFHHPASLTIQPCRSFSRFFCYISKPYHLHINRALTVYPRSLYTMGSLWGSKKDDDREDTSVRPQNGESSEHAEPRASEANERTRLLPPPSQGYLSPDDPAVSTSSLSCVCKIIQVIILLFMIAMELTANDLDRYPRTTSGAYDSCVTSPYSSPS